MFGDGKTQQPRSVVLITEASPNFRHVFLPKMDRRFDLLWFQIEGDECYNPIFAGWSLGNDICLAFFFVFTGWRKNLVLSFPTPKQNMLLLRQSDNYNGFFLTDIWKRPRIFHRSSCWNCRLNNMRLCRPRLQTVQIVYKPRWKDLCHVYTVINFHFL